MKVLEWLCNIDTEFTLWLNHDGGALEDWLWWTVSTRLVWVPLALMFLYFVLRERTSYTTKVFHIVGLTLTVCLCDQLSASFFKPFFMRLRPSHEPYICDLLHYIGDYRGGKYGFVSSHAANAFGVFAYVKLLFRNKTTTRLLLIFVSFVGYSRIYLGVHYFGDVLCGALLGFVIGRLVFTAVVFANKIAFFSNKTINKSLIQISYYEQNKRRFIPSFWLLRLRTYIHNGAYRQLVGEYK